MSNNNSNSECKCSKCSSNSMRFVLVSAQTHRRHAQQDIVRQYQSGSSSSVVEVMSNDNDIEIDFEDNVDAEDQVEDMHIEDLLLFDIDSLFDSESEDESIIEAIILDISDDESDDFREHFSSSNMPVNFTHAFIASFAAFFISKYVVNSGSAVLLKFLNKVLAHFGQSFRLPLSINGVNSMTSLSNMTRGVQQFVACGDCNKVYEESNVVPECCDFKRLSGRECGNALFFATSRALTIPKKIYIMASSDAQRKRLERENSVRWSELHDLVYFNLMECIVINLMPNLYLGTAKRIMKKWRSSGLITDAHLAEMQLDADKLVLPENYTPLGTKIGRGFPFMKADEWKSWCLVYSPVLLRGCLPEAYLSNWTTFVNACQYLSMPSISMAHLDEVHQSLEVFCRECEKLYKVPFLLPNMHLHLHLRETVLNFGPVYGYWLFSFERCNDILKNYATNRKDGFEGTYMKKYLEEVYQGDLICQTLPIIRSEHSAIILELTASTANSIATSTSTAASIQFDINAFLDSPEINFDIIKRNEPLLPSALSLALKDEISMDESEYEHLLEYYCETYDDQTLVHYCQAGHSNNFVNNWIQKFESINLLGQIYKSKTKNQHGSFMQALFETSDGRSTKPYAGQIQYLFVNTAVNSFAGHASQHEVLLQPRAGEGVEVNEVGFEDDSMNSILPMHRICYPVAVGEHLGLEGKVQMCVVPLPQKIYI
ncbi:hypothetical protein PHYBLDRAFT_161810 [Phycomyces blakesleeanus NRRL 1555(-)]|uniref:Uncharacterized protein n=1 Tax=Phycomyces blakesleeanus (strain ATCC 8743b / DSM 1359 / FGSC 10004 / NBRC 33097 / NRRL 1555) TaxID=763407 RepID=A0A167R9V1_PHYB8|nr:hypothetical protein PHYBLDRAFT_161810 [Phycomyces blakesleeanus NRRL 1555(-)]OAD81184.1 hypothetical protein PHYBLDRAFT_161810 [Phycomyces blakesleeanus NRRL 1555(-)]|eukprot:XP_018299224.1 hypothetical protein PHYBLDRAFT_161810 [Phycomyces blakesleeanus NRRL 1555(-)]